MGSETNLLTPTKKGQKNNVIKVVSAIDINLFNYYIKGKLKGNSHSYLGFGKCCKGQMK